MVGERRKERKTERKEKHKRARALEVGRLLPVLSKF